MRFLAVDDDPTFLEVLKNFMKYERHHELKTATSAAEAIEMVRAAPHLYDGFFLDIFMPEMNGIELCDVLRGMEPFHEVPIIMLTVASQRHMIDDAFVAGATDYLIKPLDPQELKTRITMAEELHEQLRQAPTFESRAQINDQKYPRVIDFEAEIPLRGQESAIEYLALKNYLMTLDRRGLIAHAVFGVHFENASQIYIRSDSTGFLEALDNVASAISDGLEGHKFIFAYAGAGDFVVVTLQQASVNMRTLEAHINNTLSRLTTVSAVKGLPTPRVRVGNEVRNGLFGERRVEAVLEQAIRNAQASVSPALSEERHLLLLREAMKQ